MADRLCPGAAADRESWQFGVERHAEAAAHTDNLVPVARAERNRQAAARRNAGRVPERFAKYAGLNSTQPHSAHLSDTIHNQSARRIETIPELHQMKPALVGARYAEVRIFVTEG